LILNKNYLIPLCFLANWFSLIGQSEDITSLSILGNTGQVLTGNAYFSADRTFFFGMTHFDQQTSFTYDAGVEKERSFFLNSTFLPFLELSFRLTKRYGKLSQFNPIEGNIGIGDRSYTARIRLLKETKRLPALAIGLNDPFSATSFFNSQYIVASKKLVDKQLKLYSHLGYGVKFGEANSYILQGLWGSMNLQWQYLETLLEYDGNQLNVGVKSHWKNRLYLNAALMQLKYFTGTVAIRFQL